MKTKIEIVDAFQNWLEHEEYEPDPIFAAAMFLAWKGAIETMQQEAQEKLQYTTAVFDVDLMYIPGGRFEMGTESPSTTHWVQISPFFMGETPVTNKQYEDFLEVTKHREPDHWQDQRLKAKHPVTNISWHDAMAFCAWLSKIDPKLEYTLPSEAQWEFAARGTDGRQYPWGNEVPDDMRAIFGKGPGGEPEAVGSCPAGKGPFGTLDQAGNVLEWCLDVWDIEAYAKRKLLGRELINPVSVEGKKDWRSLRGGSFWFDAEVLRCAYRYGYLAEDRCPYYGFRVVAKYKNQTER